VTQTVEITVTREETATAYTGPTVVLAGSTTTLTATVREDGSGALSPDGQAVTLTLGADSCTGHVSGDTASCDVTVSSALGPQPITASFGGDAYYLPSADTSQTAIVFAFPATGAFLIGDQTNAAATPGTTVLFWGSEWYLDNQLSGGPAPTDFKGFAGTLHPDPVGCSGTWMSQPGNSPPPADGPLPSYMGVLVTASVDVNGKTRSGGVLHIVVVQPGSGYAPNPGHDGTGTIVGTYC
jgi:hypothetical protein